MIITQSIKKQVLKLIVLSKEYSDRPPPKKKKKTKKKKTKKKKQTNEQKQKTHKTKQQKKKILTIAYVNACVSYVILKITQWISDFDNSVQSQSTHFSSFISFEIRQTLDQTAYM